MGSTGAFLTALAFGALESDGIAFWSCFWEAVQPSHINRAITLKLIPFFTFRPPKKIYFNVTFLCQIYIYLLSTVHPAVFLRQHTGELFEGSPHIGRVKKA